MKLALTLVLAAAALPAYAADVQTRTPVEAMSLEAGAVRMVSYFVPAEGDLYTVTATWIAGDDAAPQRLVLQLDEGDRVSFSVPGHADTLFTFARDTDAVSVSAEPAEARIRNASL